VQYRTPPTAQRVAIQLHTSNTPIYPQTTFSTHTSPHINPSNPQLTHTNTLNTYTHRCKAVWRSGSSRETGTTSAHCLTILPPSPSVSPVRRTDGKYLRRYGTELRCTSRFQNMPHHPFPYSSSYPNPPSYPCPRSYSYPYPFSCPYPTTYPVPVISPPNSPLSDSHHATLPPY
jgi:hypothetical protein